MKRHMTNKRSIAVIGLGYVGLPLAELAKENGYKVTGIDISREKIDQLKDSSLPTGQAGLDVTIDFSKIKDASVIIICVPTPVYENHMPNLEPVENACRSVGEFLSKGQLVILESTINPGVCESVAIPILEKESGLKAGRDFYLAHCPERINPGDENWTVENIPRVVGGLEEKSLKEAYEFYSSIISGQIKKMGSLQEAEAVKIVESDLGIAIKDAKVAVLGLAYKPEIEDCRESPSFEIIKELKKHKAEVVSYDPFVLDKSTVKTLDEAVKNADALILATCHKVFKKIKPDYLLKNGVKVLVDGRNCLAKEKFIEAGIIYRGIGR